MQFSFLEKLLLFIANEPMQESELLNIPQEPYARASGQAPYNSLQVVRTGFGFVSFVAICSRGRAVFNCCLIYAQCRIFTYLL